MLSMLSNMLVPHSRSLLSAVAILAAACVDIQGPQLEPIGSHEILSKVSIGSDAVIIRVGDTLLLEAKASAVDGSPLAVNKESVKWSSEDPSQVQVTPEGVLIAKKVTVTPVSIVVAYQHGPVTMKTTVPVEVTENKLQASSVKLVSLDSNRVGAKAILGTPRIRVELYDDDNNKVITEVRIPVTARHPVKVNFLLKGGPEGEPVYSINNDAGLTGKFWIRTSVNLYGNTIADSIEFLGLYPASLSFSVGVSFITGEVTPFAAGYGGDRIHLQPCALIIVNNFDLLGLLNVDLVFSDSADSTDDCAAVDMTQLRAGLQAAGFFPVSQFTIRGNLYGISPISAGVRRSSRIGAVEAYARNSATKERYPVEIKYHYIDIGEVLND